MSRFRYDYNSIREVEFRISYFIKFLQQENAAVEPKSGHQSLSTSLSIKQEPCLIFLEQSDSDSFDKGENDIDYENRNRVND